jgi:hypothetical protein
MLENVVGELNSQVAANTLILCRWCETSGHIYYTFLGDNVPHACTAMYMSGDLLLFQGFSRSGSPCRCVPSAHCFRVARYDFLTSTELS